MDKVVAVTYYSFLYNAHALCNTWESWQHLTLGTFQAAAVLNIG